MKLKLQLGTWLCFLSLVLLSIQSTLAHSNGYDNKSTKTEPIDSDADGVSDDKDLDDDNDGIKDADESFGMNPSGDDDHDGILNYRDADFCKLNKRGICKNLDNDNDGVPNHLDLDSDNDGITDVVESGGKDYDHNGKADGAIGETKRTSGIPNSAQEGTTPINTDKDKKADFLDADSDNDGILDNMEAQSTLSYIFPSLTVTAFGILDNYGNGLLVVDTDRDGIYDFQDFDSDNDGILDAKEKGNSKIKTIADLKDSDADLSFGGDVDYRDIFDVNPPNSATLEFDGVDDYVQGPQLMSKFNEENTTGITMMCWIKNEADDNDTNSQFLFGEHNALEVRSKGSTFEVYGKFTTPYNRSHIVSFSRNNVFKKGIWRHIALSIDFEKNEALLYVDGKWVHSQNLAYPGRQDITGFYSEVTKLEEQFMLGRVHEHSDEYYAGNIDEMRFFKTVLVENEIKDIVFQEIQNHNGAIKGAITPHQIGVVKWQDLELYYTMNNIVNFDIVDASGNNNSGFIKNMASLDIQTAPMPYVTKQDGFWHDKSTWLYGEQWSIPGDGVVDNTSNSDENYKWGIYELKHDIILTNLTSTLGSTKKENGIEALAIIINGMDGDKNKDIVFTIGAGDEDINLSVSKYLELNGAMNFNGTSKLFKGAEATRFVASSYGQVLRNGIVNFKDLDKNGATFIGNIEELKEE
ncbi:MAG: LamG-like jellyroll fold domain-containing protein [Jejuia sp.]